MRVPLGPYAHGPQRATWAWVCLVVVLCGCGRTVPSPVEVAGLDTEYVSIEDQETSIVLSLGQDGTFSVRGGVHDRDRELVMRPESAPLAAGTWAYGDDTLELQGDGWTARYEADSTRVEIPGRADTLSSLRWVTSTEGSPFSACDLVSMSEFDEFLHPTEGDGSVMW